MFSETLLLFLLPFNILPKFIKLIPNLLYISNKNVLFVYKEISAYIFCYSTFKLLSTNKENILKTYSIPEK